MGVWEAIDKAEVTTTKKDFTPVPEGNYKAEITDVEIKEDMFQTSISVEYTITDGDFKGRKLWFNTNISDEIAEKYPARLTIVKAQICKMAGVDSTAGDPMGVLAGVKGNLVDVSVKHTQNKKDPTKHYVNVYCNGKTEGVPF